MKRLINSVNQPPTYLKITLVISILVFIISLTQPAFYIDKNEDPNAYSNSLILFLLGWMSSLGGAIIPFIIWLANPLYILSIILAIRNKPLGLYCALGASCLALAFSQLPTIMTSESGSSSVITGRGLGFNLWFTSFIILTIGLILKDILTNPKKHNGNGLPTTACL